MNLLLLALAISIVVQGFFFFFANKYKTDTVTDLSYGLSFVIIAIASLFLAPDSTYEVQVYRCITATVIMLWGVRLASFLYIRIRTMKKDARFDSIRDNFLKFAQFWTLQGVSVWFIIGSSVHFISQETLPKVSPMVFGLGISLSILGLIVEAVADYQKFMFKNIPSNEYTWTNVGLWKYSRHPNYLGEMLVWWGLWFAGIQSFSGLGWLSILSPLFITFLLLFVSGIPILERKNNTQYAGNPAYEQYKERTGLLFPKLFR